jgi:hypothetical protein
MDEKKSLKFTFLLLGIDIDLFAGVADPSHVIMVCVACSNMGKGMAV